MTNEVLSSLMFDYRNPVGFDYDGDLLCSVKIPAKRSLIIVQLIGQHYTYKDRYPESFAAPFKGDEYSFYPDNHRADIAAYDNSICYTDSILDAFIQRLESKKACLIYLSDHGEEVHEYGDYIGHGTAATSDGFKNQIRVPFMVWGSSSFRKSEKWLKLLCSRHKKIATEDLSHFLLDLADISFEEFDPTRSFINDKYDNDRNRIVMSDIDYDGERMM